MSMALTYEILGSEALTPVLIVVMVSTVVIPEIQVTYSKYGKVSMVR